MQLVGIRGEEQTSNNRRSRQSQTPTRLPRPLNLFYRALIAEDETEDLVGVVGVESETTLLLGLDTRDPCSVLLL